MHYFYRERSSRSDVGIRQHFVDDADYGVRPTGLGLPRGSRSWGLPFAAWKRNAFDGNLPLERVGVKKAQRADHLDVGRRRDLLLFGQKQLVGRMCSAPN